MVLVVFIIALAVLLALATGGRFASFAYSRFAGLGWLAAAVLSQLLGATISRVYVWGLVVSALFITVFLARNRRRAGVALLAWGFLGNALVVVLNGAMPVTQDALARAGLGSSVIADPRHEPVTASTRLAWLGDAIPLALPGMGQAVSLGDLLIAAGAGLAVYTGMSGGRRAPRRRPVLGRRGVHRRKEDS